MEKRPIFCCRLEITATERGEWQGVMRTGDETQAFRSMLELLRLIRSETGPALPVPPGK